MPKTRSNGRPMQSAFSIKAHHTWTKALKHVSKKARKSVTAFVVGAVEAEAKRHKVEMPPR